MTTEYHEGSDEWKVQKKYESVIDMMLKSVGDQMEGSLETLRRIYEGAGMELPPLPDFSSSKATGQALLFQRTLAQIIFISKQLKALSSTVHKSDRAGMPAPMPRDSLATTAAELDALMAQAAPPAEAKKAAEFTPPSMPKEETQPELRRERQMAQQKNQVPVIVRAKDPKEKEKEKEKDPIKRTKKGGARSSFDGSSSAAAPASKGAGAKSPPQRSKSTRQAGETESKIDKKKAAKEAKEAAKLAKLEAKRKAKEEKLAAKEAKKNKGKGAAKGNQPAKASASSSSLPAAKPKPRAAPVSYPVLPDEDEVTEYNGLAIPPKQALPKLSFSGMPVSNEEIDEFKEYQRIKLKQEERENLLFLRRKKTAEAAAAASD